ncbi:hypothetical protein QC762_404492 [Podospora pseudocomata]|uniref:Rhodopsin domain-containing protein n=1 Tax=Podospora pseudocomata TaxID=2093779 RepID=A0ABR0GH91_9PEZI|nr:hypothetical protein QC762_404492 [Podospora pseudocomata]
MATYVTEQSTTAIGILFPTLAIILLGIRTYGLFRHYSRRDIGIDDVLIVPAAFLTVTSGVAMAIGAQMHIIGGHSLDGSWGPEDNVKLGKFEYAFWMGHILAIGFIKLTLLFFFRGLFKGRAERTAFDYSNWILIVLVILWTVLFLFLEIFACGLRPESGWESFESLRTKCMDTFGMLTGCSVFSWVLDLAIFIEPLIMIRTLNMSLKRKVQASIVFLFSGFAVIAGLLRMIPWIQIYMQDVRNPTIRILADDLPVTDQEGVVSIVLFWTYMEIGVGFIVSCVPRSAWIWDKLPSLTPLLSKMSRSFTSVASRSSTTKTGTADHDSERKAQGMHSELHSQRSLVNMKGTSIGSRRSSENLELGIMS